MLYRNAGDQAGEGFAALIRRDPGRAQRRRNRPAVHALAAAGRPGEWIDPLREWTDGADRRAVLIRIARAVHHGVRCPLPTVRTTPDVALYRRDGAPLAAPSTHSGSRGWDSAWSCSGDAPVRSDHSACRRTQTRQAQELGRTSAGCWRPPTLPRRWKTRPPRSSSACGWSMASSSGSRSPTRRATTRAARRRSSIPQGASGPVGPAPTPLLGEVVRGLGPDVTLGEVVDRCAEVHGADRDALAQASLTAVRVLVSKGLLAVEERELAAPRLRSRCPSAGALTWAPNTDGMATTEAAAPARHLTELTLDFLAYLELERGLSRNTLRGLPIRSAAVRRLPHASRGRSARRRAGRSDGIRVGDGRRPRGQAACRARDAPAEDRLSALVLPPPPARADLPGYDPTSELRPPRARARLPKVLSRDEVASLLAQPRGADPAALRDRALLETMYALRAARASEATALTVSELDLEAGILRARGKGSKERIVPIGSGGDQEPEAVPREGPSPLRRNPGRAARVRQPARDRGSRAKVCTRSSSATARSAPGSSSG